MIRPQIVYCHLNDDCSGSPRMLVQSIRALAEDFPQSLVFVSSSQYDGLLGRSGIALRRYHFRKSLRHPWLGLSFLAGQLQLLLKIAFARPAPGAIVYVNTLLPVGAALYGSITRRPVVFHSHEIPSSALERILFAITLRCSSLVICVSQSHARQLALDGGSRKFTVVPNGLDPEFARAAARARDTSRPDGKFRVLYATAALAPHKGCEEFFRLADALLVRNDIELVLAIPQHESGRIPRQVPPNVRICCGEESLVPLYRAADLVLNLSVPELWIETFGLTVLEAMAFGVPAIVPPAGGPTEIVREGVEGFHVHSRNTARLAEVITGLADDPAAWNRLSLAALRRAADFTPEAYEAALSRALSTVRRGAQCAPVAERSQTP